MKKEIKLLVDTESLGKAESCTVVSADSEEDRVVLAQLLSKKCVRIEAAEPKKEKTSEVKI